MALSYRLMHVYVYCNSCMVLRPGSEPFQAEIEGVEGVNERRAAAEQYSNPFRPTGAIFCQFLN